MKLRPLTKNWWFKSVKGLYVKISKHPYIVLIFIIAVQVIGVLIFNSRSAGPNKPNTPAERPIEIVICTWVACAVLIAFMARAQLKLVSLVKEEFTKEVFEHEAPAPKGRQRKTKSVQVDEVIIEESAIRTLILLQAALVLAITSVVNAIVLAGSDNAQSVAIIATLPFTLILSATIPFYVETRKVLQAKTKERDSALESFVKSLGEFERNSEPIWQYFDTTIASEWALLFQQWLYEVDLKSKSKTPALRDVLLRELGIYAQSFNKQQTLLTEKAIDSSNEGVVLTPKDKQILRHLLAANEINNQFKFFKSNSQSTANDPLRPPEDEISAVLAKTLSDDASEDESLIYRRLKTWIDHHTICRIEAKFNNATYPLHKFLRLILSIDGENKYTRSRSEYATWLYPTDETIHWLTLNRLRSFSKQYKRTINDPSEKLNSETLSGLIEQGINRHLTPAFDQVRQIDSACQSLNIDYHPFTEDIELFGDLFQRYVNKEIAAETLVSKSNNPIPQQDRLLTRNILYALAFLFAKDPTNIHAPRRFRAECSTLKRNINLKRTSEVDKKRTSLQNSIPKGHAATEIRSLWVDIRSELADQIGKEDQKLIFESLPLLAFELTHHKGPLQNWIRASNSVHRRYRARKLIAEIRNIESTMFRNKSLPKQILAIPLKISLPAASAFISTICELPKIDTHADHDLGLPVRLSVSSLATIQDFSLETLINLGLENRDARKPSYEFGTQRVW